MSANSIDFETAALSANIVNFKGIAPSQNTGASGFLPNPLVDWRQSPLGFIVNDRVSFRIGLDDSSTEPTCELEAALGKLGGTTYASLAVEEASLDTSPSYASYTGGNVVPKRQLVIKIGGFVTFPELDIERRKRRLTVAQLALHATNQSERRRHGFNLALIER